MLLLILLTLYSLTSTQYQAWLKDFVGTVADGKDKVDLDENNAAGDEKKGTSLHHAVAYARHDNIRPKRSMPAV